MPVNGNVVLVCSVTTTGLIQYVTYLHVMLTDADWPSRLKVLSMKMLVWSFKEDSPNH